MSERHRRRAQAAAKPTLVTIAVFLAGSTFLLWSWNTLAAGSFQLPEARFENAVAFGGLMAGAFLFRFLVARIASVASPRFGHYGGVVS